MFPLRDTTTKCRNKQTHPHTADYSLRLNGRWPTHQSRTLSSSTQPAEQWNTKPNPKSLRSIKCTTVRFVERIVRDICGCAYFMYLWVDATTPKKATHTHTHTRTTHTYYMCYPCFEAPRVTIRDHTLIHSSRAHLSMGPSLMERRRRSTIGTLLDKQNYCRILRAPKH